MRRLQFLMTAVIGALVLSGAPSAAQEESTVKAKMTQALAASARGKCADNIMSPMLLDACEQQIDANRKILEPLGSINSARFMGVQEMGNGIKADAYRVEFERGTMMWFASLDGAGKLVILWSNGQVRSK